jgi:hypothetical protein
MGSAGSGLAGGCSWLLGARVSGLAPSGVEVWDLTVTGLAPRDSPPDRCDRVLLRSWMVLTEVCSMSVSSTKLVSVSSWHERKTELSSSMETASRASNLFLVGLYKLVELVVDLLFLVGVLGLPTPLSPVYFVGVLGLP